MGIGTGSLPTWTTVVNLTGASNSSEGADPTCSGGSTGASSIGASSPDVWVRFTTGPTTEGVSLAATGSAYTSGPPATAISGGTTYLAGVAVALYQTNSCPGSGTAPILINRGNGLPGTCDNFGIMSHGSTAGAFTEPQNGFYINVNPNTTYYVRFYVPYTSQTQQVQFNLSITPLPTPPANGAATNLASGCTIAQSFNCNLPNNCNYGAIQPNSTFVPSCWFTLENSTFYKFPRPAGNFTVSVTGIQCQSFGNAQQVALFNSCTFTTSTQIGCNTGVGTGAHLHFEVHASGGKGGPQIKNPREFLKSLLTN